MLFVKRQITPQIKHNKVEKWKRMEDDKRNYYSVTALRNINVINI